MPSVLNSLLKTVISGAQTQIDVFPAKKISSLKGLIVNHHRLVLDIYAMNFNPQVIKIQNTRSILQGAACFIYCEMQLVTNYASSVRDLKNKLVLLIEKASSSNTVCKNEV